MRWSEVDLTRDNGRLRRSAARTARRTPSICTRKPFACLTGLATRPRRGSSEQGGREDCRFLGNGRNASQRLLQGEGRIDGRMKEILGDKFQPWRTHDLRRTAASGMAALGFQPHVIERVLNHVSGAQGGLVGVYQRHEYREERRRRSSWPGARM